MCELSSRPQCRLQDKMCVFQTSSVKCGVYSMVNITATSYPPAKAEHREKFMEITRARFHTVRKRIWLLSCVRLFCDPMDYSPPGSSVHGILQARILEWVAISFSRGSSRPRDRTHIACITGGFFTAEPPGEPEKEVTDKQRENASWILWHKLIVGVSAWTRFIARWNVNT